jgi:uncharacterized protein (UPF0216 family)
MISVFRAKDPMERALDAVLTYEIRKLNTHLPRHRQTMSDLMKSSDPTIEAVDGTSILLRTDELEELSRIVPREYQDRLKLPIVILRRMEFGKSTYTVSGEPIEEFTVKKILGETNADFHQMYMDRESFFLYRPQVVELLRKYHSLFVIGFGLPRELFDYVPSRD